MHNLKYLKWALIPIATIFALLSGPALAATSIEPSAGFTHTSDADVLVINPPNSHGLSVNYYSQFVVDNPLEIVTAPLSLSAENQFLSPKLVVIIADTITLNSQINLLGTATDILFLNPKDGGKINCTNCTFNNVLRGTLAAAKPKITLTTESSAVGELEADSNSGININGLYAPGVIGFDIVAKTLSLNGTLDTNQRVMPHANGGLVNMPHSNLTAGSGGFDIVIGMHKWNYEANNIVSSTASDDLISLNGKINSIYTKITSASNLTVNTNIDSQVDYVVSVPYLGITHLPSERIELQTLANRALVIKGNLVTSLGDSTNPSTSAVKLRSLGTLHLQNNSIIANNVEVAAKGLFKNHSGSLVAGNIYAAAGAIHNEGRIEATNRADLWSEMELANQYGGMIQADEIVLTSAAQIVRNGSRTPYKSTSPETDYYLDIDGSTFVNSSDLNLQSLGTFYYLGFDIETKVNNRTMAPNNFAHIVANDLTISAQAIENINPYYLPVVDQSDVNLSLFRLNQVSIYALNTLQFITPSNGYVLNSSAKIAQGTASKNEKDLKASINTGLFLNDRYRVLTLLTLVDGELLQDNSYLDGFRTETAFYSPPGRFRFDGNTSIKATSSFISDMSYLEFYGDTLIDTNIFRDYGVANQAYVNTSTNNTQIVDLSNYGGSIATYSYVTSTGVVFQDPGDLDSLFYASKNIQLTASVENADDPILFQTLNPFDYFIAQTIQSNITSEYYFRPVQTAPITADFLYGGQIRMTFDYTRTYTNQTIAFNTIEQIKETGQIEVDYAYSVETNCVNPNDSICQQYLPTYDSGGSEANPTRTESLFQQLTEYYEKIKDAIAEFFSELNWWNS